MINDRNTEEHARSSTVLDDRCHGDETARVDDLAPLGRVFGLVRMSGVFYCPSELTEPWGLTIPPMAHCLWFHVVTSGGGTIHLDGAANGDANGDAHGDPGVVMRAGDIVLVPHGTGHRAWGATPAPTPLVFDLPHDDLSERYGVLRHGGGGDRTEVVCGGVRFDHPAARHLIEALPPVIRIDGARVRRPAWLRATLDLIADELTSGGIGSEEVVSRLCDIVVIQALRAWIEDDPAARTGWLGAVHDPQIGRAVTDIHGDPAADWSVARLAADAAMSRSAFSARFTELVGEPAMRYVTRWRMYRALALLETSDATVAAVAREVGYDSEAAFSRAFKRTVGVSPRAARLAS